MNSKQLEKIAGGLKATALEDSKTHQYRMQIYGSTGKPYVVSQCKSGVNEGQWQCGCMGWIRHRNCKHLNAMVPVMENAIETFNGKQISAPKLTIAAPAKAKPAKAPALAEPQFTEDEQHLAYEAHGDFPPNFAKRMVAGGFIFIHAHGNADAVLNGMDLIDRVKCEWVKDGLAKLVGPECKTLKAGHVFVGAIRVKNAVANCYLDRIGKASDVAYLYCMSSSLITIDNDIDDIDLPVKPLKEIKAITTKKKETKMTTTIATKTAKTTKAKPAKKTELKPAAKKAKPAKKKTKAIAKPAAKKKTKAAKPATKKKTKAKPAKASSKKKKTVTIYREYKGREYKATLNLETGKVNLKGKTYNTVSAAAEQVTKGVATNGWKFWYTITKGEWEYIHDSVRKDTPFAKVGTHA